MKALDRPETFLIKIVITFFTQIFKERRCDTSGDRFCKFHKSLIIVKYHVVSRSCVTVELTYVTSQGYVMNTNDFIDHPLAKDSVSAHGPPHHLNPALATGKRPMQSY